MIYVFNSFLNWFLDLQNQSFFIIFKEPTTHLTFLHGKDIRIGLTNIKKNSEKAHTKNKKESPRKIV